MIEWVLVILLITVLIYLFWKYSELKGTIENRARDIYEKWKSSELEKESQRKADLIFNEWKQKEEEKLKKEVEKIRQDAIEKSKTVIRGKVTEHLVPFFPDFKYNPRDARFMGSPVDLVVFDGLDEGELRKIILMEVKTGKIAKLSDREKMVRDCIDSKNVDYEVVHVRSNSINYIPKEEYQA